MKYLDKNINHNIIGRKGFPGGSVLMNPPASAGDARDAGSISVLGRSPREGIGNPFQYSCLENSMDRGDWQATVHGVTKNWTRLSMHAIKGKTNKLFEMIGISRRTKISFKKEKYNY